MKKVSLLILVSMILLLAFTSCDMLPESVAGPLTSVKDTVVGGFNTAKNTVLGLLGMETEPEHEHVWTDATCESAKTCECGETEGEALGHTWTEATCESPKTCSVCNKTEGNALKHDWTVADCENAATCKLCGETSGDALGHTWIEATCENAKYCVECNKTEGIALGHDWMDATCVLPKTCKVCATTEGVANGHTWTSADCDTPATCVDCGATEGECIGHNWTEATCVLPKICLNCGSIDGEPTGHDWADATCTEAKTCKNGCGLTQGSPLGHDWSEATCVDPSVCNTCGEISDADPSGHDYEDATCVLPKTCKLCGGTEGEALGHTGGTATCNALAVCDVCGESYGEYDSHNIVTTDTTFACTKCNVSFTVSSEGVFFNGDDMNGTTIGSYTGTAIGNYVGTGSAYNGGANKVVSENGVWKAITDEARVDGTNTAGETQMQVWLPQIKTGFKEFNAGNKSIGAMSFKLKLDLTYAKDVFAVLLHNSNGWNPENGIRTNVLQIQPIVADGVVTGYKAGVWNDNNQTTVTLPVDLVEGGSATEWFEVQMFFVMDSEKDVVTTYYYINGALLASGSYTNTVTDDALSCVYINLNAWNKGTGFYMDDILFGHTKNSHFVFDNQAHVVTPATCTEPETCSCGFTKGEAAGHDWVDATCTAPKTCKACGATEGAALGHSLELSYNEEAATLACACGVTLTLDEYREWDGEGEDGKIAHSPNGKVDTVKENGTWGFIFNPATEVAPGEGWYEYPGSGCFGAQIQPWIPSNNRSDCLAGFSCENNAVGVISFDIKYNITRHENRDTDFQLGVGKPRNASNWGDGGSWTDDQITILSIADYLDTGVEVRGGVNSSMTLATIGVENGWSEWFNVTIAIEMLDTGFMNTYYYINGVFCGSYSRDLSKADADGRLLNPMEIETFQFSGWTYAANTGVMFDNMVFGYTAGGHNYLNGEAHEKLAATCTEPERCSCGFVYGPALGHTNGAATCTEDAICSVCGEVIAKATGHNLVGSNYANNNLVYSCANGCGVSYNLTGHYFDGTETFTNASADKNAYTGSSAEGYYDYFNKSETPSNGQAQLWIPSNGKTPDTLDDFTCANNSVGIFALSIKPNNLDADIEFILAERRNDQWGSGWGDSSINVLNIKKIADGSVAIKGGIDNYSTDIATVSLAENDGWIDIVMEIELSSEKVITVNFFVNGKLAATVSGPMDIYNGRIRAMYIKSTNTTLGAGFAVDNMVFGYVADESFYNEEIAAENVTSATLKTIVAGKLKQCEQCTTVNGEGGTPVYVLANKDGAEVEAIYISRTTAWGSPSENKQEFTEFRFDVDGTKKATKISFDYKINGTVEENPGQHIYEGETIVKKGYTFKDLAGNDFVADAYVQIKTAASHPLAGDNYPELSGTDLILDGEWHTMTYEFDEPLAIINILLNLYHFQGEMLLANLSVEFYEPFYNEEIAAENVTSDTLKTIVTSKFKQCDQCTTVNAQGGTPVYVLANKDGAQVEALYVSRTYAWTGSEAEDFTEFRFAINGEAKTGPKVTGISFDYKIEGTVEKNAEHQFTGLNGEKFYADAYVQIKTAANHELAGDNYPELSGSDLILDGEWHTFTVTFDEPLQLVDFLLNLYHFQGKLLISNIVVEFEA